MAGRMIECPECDGRSVGWDERNKHICLCRGSVTIPDRRKPTAIEDALRAEVAALRAKIDEIEYWWESYILRDRDGVRGVWADHVDAAIRAAKESD